MNYEVYNWFPANAYTFKKVTSFDIHRILLSQQFTMILDDVPLITGQLWPRGNYNPL